MSSTSQAPKILVASDNLDDAKQIQKRLESEFENVRASTNPERAVEDFEAFEPHVLVLAFDSLIKAQTHYLGLYRLGSPLSRHGHRTVILCHKDELPAVVDLCKKQYFDDYVLYWPQNYDGSRLGMSIRIACREIDALRAQGKRPVELLAHARHVDELDQILGHELDGEHDAERAQRSLAHTEREIAGAIDEFSDRLISGSQAAGVDVKDPQALAKELERLKDRQVEVARRSKAAGIESVNARARQLKDRIEPALAGARALAREVRKIRPIVMVVEDDEFARQLVGRTLDSHVWEVVFANDSTEALSQLRRTRPDIILMDIRLPGMDGVSLTQRLKSSPHLADIPVIIMTGDARREVLVNSVAAGAAAFVVKPFTREMLNAKLEKVLLK